MKLELVSYNLCPFVQSSVITTLHKRVRCRVTYIDLANPPPWFDAASPNGQVPLLKADNAIIFESAVINEFLDETSGGGMMPEGALAKAESRAWTQFCGGIHGDMYDLTGAKDAAAQEDKLYDLEDKLQRVEAVKGDGDYFNGARLCVIDAIYAPLFMRLALIKPALAILDPARYPRLHRWSEHLLRLPAVRDSAPPGFAGLFRALAQKRGWVSAGAF